MANINNLSNSEDWDILQTLFKALQDAPNLAGIPVLRGAITAKPVGEVVNHWIILADDLEDTLSNKPGQVDKRNHPFRIVCLARGANADSDANAMNWAASQVLRSSLKQVTQAHRHITNLSEISKRSESASIELGGSLCVSTWGFEYRKQNPL